jgi:hypothetical protein
MCVSRVEDFGVWLGCVGFEVVRMDSRFVIVCGRGCVLECRWCMGMELDRLVCSIVAGWMGVCVGKGGEFRRNLTDVLS